MDKNPTDYEHVNDRPGHDMRYAIDAAKLKNELGWKPEYTNFEQGLRHTVEWYRQHKDWWKPLKQETEAKYKELGR